MSTSHIAPTTEQWDQSGLVETELLECFERLTREGIDWRIVLTGSVGAVANLLMAKAGPDEVPVFFARTAAQTMHLSSHSPH